MIGHYLLIALRSFRRNPLATAIKLLALTLGLVCFLAAYVFGDFIGRVDARWANAGRIHSIVQYSDSASAARLRELPATAATLARYLRADFPELVVARLAPHGARHVQAGDRSENLQTRSADADLLRIFDLEMIEGDAQSALDRPYSAVIAAAPAGRLFGNESALGRVLRISDYVDVTITGVADDIPAPSSLSGPLGAFDLLLTPEVIDDLVERDFPFPFRPSEMESWGGPFGATYILAPDDSRSWLRRFNERLEDFAARRVPPEQGAARFVAEPTETAIARFIDREVFNGPSRLSLRGLLFGFGALVLVIGCFNFANLAMADAVGRSREIGLRKTVGAARRQIAAQSLMETALLAVFSLTLTLVLIAVILRVWDGAAAMGLQASSWARPSFWAGILAILMAVCALAGAYPCLVLANVRPMAALRTGPAAAAGRGVRSVLIGLQFAAAGGLLAGIFIVALQNMELRRAGLALTDDALVYLDTTQVGGNLLATVSEDVFRAQLLEHPAITGYTMTGDAPFTNSQVSQEDIGLSEDAAAATLPVMTRSVASDYFGTVGAQILTGRDFDEELDSDRSSVKVILDAATARRIGLTLTDAVGQLVYISNFSMRMSDGEMVASRFRYPATIVGIADRMPHELRAGDGANYAYRLSSSAGTTMSPIVRIAGDDVAAGLAHLDAVWARLAPGAPMNRWFLDQAFDRAFTMFNRITAGLAALAMVAVAIAAMGLFGMASFIVQRRLREIGVRKTLGASSARVLALMLWDFSKPVIVANLIAWPLAFVAARAYLNLFVTRIDLTPWPFLGALAASLLIAWLAVAVHVLRAAAVQPALVLRTE